MTTTLTQQSQKLNDLRAILNKAKPELEKAMAAHMDPDRLIRLTLTAATKNPALFNCTVQSIGLALLTASQLGLEPNGRDAHLVPYGNECQLLPDYKGLIRLAYQNPRVRSFRAASVRERDVFDYSYGTDEFLTHKPADGDRGELTHAYAVCKLKDADPVFVVMDKTDVLKRRNASRAAKSQHSPWNQWPDEMWAKTAVKSLSKFVPLGDEFSAAVEHDTTVDSRSIINGEPPARLTSGKTPTDHLADALNDDEPPTDPDHGAAGEESNETPFAIEDESQEPPTVAEPKPGRAMEFIDRLNRAETKEILQAIWGEAQQLKVANKLAIADYEEIKAEYEATAKKFGKKK